MNYHSIVLPTFKWSETKNYLKGKNMTPEETLEHNLLACIDSFNYAFPDEDILIVCAREKLDNDYNYGLGCIPYNRYANKMITVELNGFKSKPNVLINAKKGIINIVKKVLSNLAFT